MSSLPPAIAAWSAVLSAFAPDLAEAVGGMARRLELVIGRVRARPRPRGDDPDGYDGLARKGPYDRLLLSEWALAMDVPEEFDRRAVSGEHTFLRLDLRDRRKGVRTVALFDPGPSQLGGPRVVQLAALVTLQRRAELAKAEFAWGMLGGSGELFTTVDRATVQTFLSARRARAATEDDVAAGRARAGNTDELWLVGGAPRTHDALCLELAEALDRDEHAVGVALHRRGERLGDARLVLPTGPLCKRLLTDPFPPPTPVTGQRTPRPPAQAPPSPTWAALPPDIGTPIDVRFAPATRQLQVTFSRNEVLAWGVADGRLRSPKPKRHTFQTGTLAGIGYGSQMTELVLLGQEQGQPALRPSWRGPLPLGTAPTPAPGPGMIAQRVGFGALMDVDGGLWTWGGVHPHASAAGRAALVFPLQSEVIVVLRGADGLRVTSVRYDGALGPEHLLAGTRPDQDVRYVLSEHQTHFNSAAWLLVSGGDAPAKVFVMHSGNTSAYPLTQALPAGPGVLVGAQVSREPFAGVRWVASEQTFYVDDRAVLLTERAPIGLRVSPDARLAAWWTAEGFVEVWSLEDGKPRLQRYPP